MYHEIPALCDRATSCPEFYRLVRRIIFILETRHYSSLPELIAKFMQIEARFSNFEPTYVLEF